MAAPDPRRWRALPVLLAASFMGLLDVFIVNVAAPSIQNDLHATFGELQWVIAGYTLAYAVALVTGGRIGDRIGRRRAFLIGAAAFTLASAGCALAPTAEWLIAVRIAQGLGAALLLPQVLATIQVSFPPEERARALGAYGMTLGLASASGQLVGGGLLAIVPDSIGWRAVFAVNVPIGIAILVLAPRLVPETRRDGRVAYDVPGVILLTGALSLVLLTLVQSANGWPAWSLPALAGALATFGLFWWHERRLERRGGDPLLRTRLLSHPAFRAGAASVLALLMTNAGLFLLLAYHLQEGLGLRPLPSGLVFAPAAIGFAVVSLRGSGWAARYGMQVLTYGAIVQAVSYVAVALIAYVSGRTLQPWAILPALAAAGLGTGAVFSPIYAMVLARVPADDAGAAAGALLTATQVGAALGVAVLGRIYVQLLGSTPGRRDVPFDTLTAAFSGSMLVLAAGTLVVFALLRVLARVDAAITP